MLSTSDLLALVFGILSAVLSAIAIFVTRKTRIMINHVMDIEAHPLKAAVREASAPHQKQGNINEAIVDLLESVARCVHGGRELGMM